MVERRKINSDRNLSMFSRGLGIARFSIQNRRFSATMLLPALDADDVAGEATTMASMAAAGLFLVVRASTM